MGVVTKMFFAAFITLLVLAIVGIYLHYSLISFLKKTHYEKWKELGSPALVTNNSVKNNVAILNFLKKKEYLEMNDQELTKISLRLWNFGRIYLIFLATVICLFVVSLVTTKGKL